MPLVCSRSKSGIYTEKSHLERVIDSALHTYSLSSSDISLRYSIWKTIEKVYLVFPSVSGLQGFPSWLTPRAETPLDTALRFGTELNKWYGLWMCWRLDEVVVVYRMFLWNGKCLGDIKWKDWARGDMKECWKEEVGPKHTLPKFGTVLD